MFTILIRKNALFYNFVDILGYDGRIDIIISDAVMSIYSCVFFVFEKIVQRVFAERLALIKNTAPV